MRLRGKIAVVSGGAQNIGLAIARRLAAEGAAVVVGDLHPPPQEEGVLFCRADVCDQASCAALMDFAAQQCGGEKGGAGEGGVGTGEGVGVDILVCAAGIAVEKKALETTLSEWEQVMRVNAAGVFLCARAALPHMRARGGGAMVFIGSIEGLAANPTHAAYAASKAAVHALARAVARDHGADGVRCNAVAPGWIQTPFNDNLLAQYPDPQAAEEAVRKMHPLGRMGTPEDVAALVLWLAGSDSEFVNGQTFAVDGGRTAQLPVPAL